MDKKIDKLIVDYYKPLTLPEVNRLSREIYSAGSPKESKKALKKHEPYLKTLDDRFKNLVELRNELARNNGYGNFFEYLYEWDAIPISPEALKIKVKKVGKSIYQQIPNKIKSEPWFNTIFNSLNLKLYLPKTKTKQPLSKAENFITKNNFTTTKALNQIKYKPNKEGLYYVDYNEETKNITVHYDQKQVVHYSVLLGLIHEIGHAIHIQNLINNNLGPNEESSYKHELQALKLELAYLQTFPPKEQRLIKTTYTIQFINFDFEQKIYQNPKHDFSKIYADSMRVFLPNLKAKKNPLYVLDYSLVHHPCYSSVYSAVYTKLL